MIDVATEYAKDSQLKPDEVKMLQTWINQQPHLPNVNELQSILFLQSCYYSNEMAKTTIDTYFTVKTLCADIFLNRNPLQSPLKEILNVGLMVPLPKKTPTDDYAIILNKFMDFNTDNFNLPLMLKYFDMSIMLWLQTQAGTSNGHVICIDMAGIQFGHFLKLNPLIVKKFLYYLQEAMPLRLKSFHFFNVVSFMDKVLALIKPFMKKELFQMIRIHNTVDDFVKVVPRSCLPKDYGGELASLASLHEQVQKRIMENVDFFLNEDQELVDETKRPGQPKNVGDFFGVEGTFKKLSID